MTPAARLQAAMELLDLIDREAPAADMIMRAWFRSRRYAGSGDRRRIGALVFGVLRGRGLLDWRLEAAGATPGNRLRVLLHSLLQDGPTALPGGEVPHGIAPPDADEVAMLHRAAALAEAGAPLAARGAFPDFLTDDLIAAFGSEAAVEQAMAAQAAEVAAVDLRVNPRRTTIDAARTALAERGIEAAPFGWTGHSLRLERRQDLSREPLLLSGAIEIQDAGSQLAAALLDARPGLDVADVCAGAGGKTLAIGAAMDSQGTLLAMDIDPKRLGRLRARAERAGLTGIATRSHDLSGDIPADLAGTFDRVLVDAPCSGTGTWRRQPEQRWRLTPAQLAAHTARQRTILTHALALLRPGGQLLYVTCSVLPAENETVVTEVLSQVQQVAVVDIADQARNAGLSLPPGARTPAGFLRLSPHCHGVDGFFAAVLQRNIS